ncbi:MAG TPA: molybdopterin synthase sulfur carrier subunit [Actinobacteria bacterium]|nr:molybdopterin synthase sulfur carrier subunit [Actinomycetota bacterium]
MTSVEIPTILRTYTDGERSVTATGATLSEVVANLDSRYPGIAERLIEGDALRRFVNVYLNDEDVRFLDGLATVVAEDDTVTILPAVAGGSTTAELQ